MGATEILNDFIIIKNRHHGLDKSATREKAIIKKFAQK